MSRTGGTAFTTTRDEWDAAPSPTSRIELRIQAGIVAEGCFQASSEPPNAVLDEPPEVVLGRRGLVPHEAGPPAGALVPGVEPPVEPLAVDEHLHRDVLEPVAAHVRDRRPSR
jgi:hypothetical protein